MWKKCGETSTTEFVYLVLETLRQEMGFPF